MARSSTATSTGKRSSSPSKTRVSRGATRNGSARNGAARNGAARNGAAAAATRKNGTVTGNAPAARTPTPPPQARANDEELERIWVTYKRTKDPNLRNILIERHMHLVRSIAERVLQTLPKSIELDDLTSAGTFGLMDAIDGFDLSRGIKFKTYCTTRIRGSILDELRSQDWVPRLVRLKAHRLEKAVRKLEGELGRNPNSYELAEAMGLTVLELMATEAEAKAKTIFSLSEKWDDSDDDSELEKVEILADKKTRDPAAAINQRDILETITRNLTKKERLIIMMYYYEGLTMREIGEIMQLTESRVCQIHSNVMARLKAQLDQSQLRAV